MVINPRGPVTDKVIICIICDHFIRLSELEKLRA